MDPIREFRNAMLAAGLTPPELIEPGKLHRFSTNGKRGDDAGWCRLFPDLAGGVFGDFRSGLSESWQAQRSKPFSEAEREAFRRRCEAERQARQDEEAQRHAEAAKRGENILAAADEAPDGHAYAKKKAVPLGTHAKRGAWPQRNWKDALLLPVFGPDGKLLSVQAIHADGKKDFLKHGRTRGGFYPFGTVRGAELVLVGEGAATVAACVASSPCAAVAALSRDNLAAVGQAVRKLAPGAALVFLADNDAMPDGGNPGIAEAQRAADLVGGHVAVPELDGRKCDFWDVWRERGPEAVRVAIA
jgi:putative DNA primase/helicase